MSEPENKTIPTYPCPVCRQPVPVGAETCPNSTCQVQLKGLARVDDLGQKLYTAALEHVRAGRLVKAVEALEQATAYDPAALDAWVVLGKLYAQQERYPEARHAWEHVLTVQAGEPRAQAGLLEVERRVKARRLRQIGSWVGLVLAALLVGGLGAVLLRTPKNPPQAQAAPTPISLAQVFASDPALKGLQVTQSSDGVTLTGELPSAAEKERVVALAGALLPEAVVKAEGLVITTPANDLAAAVQQALQAESALSGLKLDVQMDGSVVFLRGGVEQAELKEKAEAAARSVAGVSAVDSSGVTVTPPPLTDAVQAALTADPTLQNLTIRVEQIGDGMHLSGQVFTEAQRDQIMSVAGKVAGVGWVDVRDVTLLPLSQRVLAALKVDAQVGALSVEVKDASNGVVLLGEAPCLSAHSRVLEVARGVAGGAPVDESGFKVAGRSFILQPGQYLSNLAELAYGDYRLVLPIWEANKDKAPAMDKFPAGTEIFVPNLICPR